MQTSIQHNFIKNLNLYDEIVLKPFNYRLFIFILFYRAIR